MPPVTVKYLDRYAWMGPSTYFSRRPYSLITVHGPRAASMDIFALMDTGADYLTLDAAVAKSLGISLTGAKKIAVSPAFGHKVLLSLVSVDVTIEGNRVNVDALFGSIGTPLVGRTAILAAIDFGIDTKGWLHA
jgi:predicted aspartyl protease